MAALPAIKGESVPTILPIGLIPASDRIIIEIKEFGNLNAGLAFVQKQNRIRPPRNSLSAMQRIARRQCMVLALTPHAALKLKPFFG